MKSYVIFLAFLAGAISCNTNSKKAEHYFNNATVNYNDKKYIDANLSIDSAIKIDSSNYGYHILKAKIQSGLNYFTESNDILNSISLKGYNLDTVNFLIAKNYFSLADFYTYKKIDTILRKSSYEKSAAHYEKAIHYNSQYFEAYLGEIKALHNNEQFEEAMIAISKAMEIFKNEMKLYVARGISKYGLNDSNGALTDLNKAIESNSLDSSFLATALRFRGGIYQDKDSLQKALIDLNKSVKLAGDYYRTYEQRGELFLKLKLFDSACLDFRKAGDLGAVAIYKQIELNCK